MAAARKGVNSVFVVKREDGVLLRVPAWMTEVASGDMAVVSAPAVPVRDLLVLASLVQSEHRLWADQRLQEGSRAETGAGDDFVRGVDKTGGLDATGASDGGGGRASRACRTSIAASSEWCSRKGGVR